MRKNVGEGFQRRFGSSVPQKLDEVPTPAVILDRETLRANLENNAIKADKLGVTRRPHQKTLSSTDATAFAHTYGQIQKVTVATASALNAIASNPHTGIKNVLVGISETDPHALAMIDRIRAATDMRVLMIIDSAAGAHLYKRAFGNNMPELMIAADTGFKREGLPITHSSREKYTSRKLREIANIRGIRSKVMGVFTYSGEAMTSRDAPAKAAEHELQRIIRFVDMCRDAGFQKITDVSTSSTPAWEKFTNKNPDEPIRITEVRASITDIGDWNHVCLDVMEPDQVAVHVLTRVRSVYTNRGEIIVDAGSRVLSKDRLPFKTRKQPGYGVVTDLKGEKIGNVIRMSEYHGIVKPCDTSVLRTLRPGDQLLITPNHVCTAVHGVCPLNNFLYVTEDKRDVVDLWAIDEI